MRGGMETGRGVDVEETLQLLDSSLSDIKWRLRPSSKRRLQTDILALSTGLRAVVMVDYGGKMPELQEHLCALLTLIRKDSVVLLPLRIMIIEDMIYILHVKGLTQYITESLSLQSQLLFVDLEQDPPKMLLNTDQNIVILELLSIQKVFSTVFPDDENGVQPSELKDVDASDTSEIIDLSRIVKDTQITLPTLNGWLLGYPVVYLFSKDHAADAIYNLSTKSLHIYQITVKRNQKSGTNQSEELTSFTVPYNLSLGQEKEPWAESFLICMLAKFELCRSTWSDLQLEVNQCYPQSIVL